MAPTAGGLIAPAPLAVAEAADDPRRVPRRRPPDPLAGARATPRWPPAGPNRPWRHGGFL